MCPAMSRGSLLRSRPAGSPGLQGPPAVRSGGVGWGNGLLGRGELQQSPGLWRPQPCGCSRPTCCSSSGPTPGVDTCPGPRRPRPEHMTRARAWACGSRTVRRFPFLCFLQTVYNSAGFGSDEGSEVGRGRRPLSAWWPAVAGPLCGPPHDPGASPVEASSTPCSPGARSHL